MTRPNITAMVALCLLAGSTWIFEAAVPSALPGSLSLLVDNAILALVFFFIARKRLPALRMEVLGYSALVFAVPGALASLSAGHVSSTTIVLIYTLVPAATIFIAAQTSQADLLSPLTPALAGIAGAALILPFALPASATGVLWLVTIILSALTAAFAGLRMHRILAGTRIIPTSAFAAAASAFVAIPLYVYERPTVVLLTWPQALLSESIHLALTAAILLLTVLLLRDLAPIAFSTRYFLIPLVTIAEGYFILHPKAPITLPVGAILLAGGTYLLIRAESREHQS